MNAAGRNRLPPPSLIDSKHKFTTSEKLIEHLTRSSLRTVGIEIIEGSLRGINVNGTGRYRVRFQPKPRVEEAGKQ